MKNKLMYVYYMSTRLPRDVYEYGIVDGIKYTNHMYYTWRWGYEKLFRM